MRGATRYFLGGGDCQLGPCTYTHIHTYTHIQGQDLRVDVEGSMMCNIDGKSKRTYLLVVRRADGDAHEVPRRYSDFIKLHKQLKTRLSKVKLPDISQLQANTVYICVCMCVCMRVGVI